MDAVAIERSLDAFIKRHKTAFYNLSTRETALLELGALTMSSEHYRLNGFTVKVRNTKGGLFTAKLTSRGYPFNFSWFECEKDGYICEIHSNLAVFGGHRDNAVYVVDVAVVRGVDSVPKLDLPASRKWVALDNASLETFVEVKKLIVYPMLLAQFIGIVHEIMPKNIRRSKLNIANGDHFAPSLISLGYLKGTSANIIKGFRRRKYRVCVIPNFDVHLSTMRRGAALTSPFLAVGEVI